MANMELRLPVTWNKHVRHCLVCLFIQQLNNYGSFWASAMLWVEFYHTLVKKLCRSRKNMLASTVNLKEVFDLVLTEWNEDWGSQNSEMRDSRYDVSPDVPKISKVSLG